MHFGLVVCGLRVGSVFKLACCWFATMVCLDWCGFDLDTGLLL